MTDDIMIALEVENNIIRFLLQTKFCYQSYNVKLDRKVEIKIPVNVKILKQVSLCKYMIARIAMQVLMIKNVKTLSQTPKSQRYILV